MKFLRTGGFKVKCKTNKTIPNIISHDEHECGLKT